MCGRYALRTSVPEIARLLGLEDVPELPPRYNITPTQSAPVCRLDRDGRRELVALRWGLVPSWAKDPKAGARMINARSETAASKPAFRAAYRRRRCLVPADGWYEWQAAPAPASTPPGRRARAPKQPWFLHMLDQGTFCFAGLWEHWHRGDDPPIESYTVLTTAPNAKFTPVHDRMPVILRPDDFPLWLGETPADAAGLEALLRPYPDDGMDCYPVSTHVNSPRNEDERCVAPLPQLLI